MKNDISEAVHLVERAKILAQQKLFDHSILVRKLRSQCNLPASIVNWIIDFLSNRSQRTKFASDCYSEWGLVPCRRSSGYEIRPLAFRTND